MSSQTNSTGYIPVLALFGVGMIGGSLALGLKKRNLVGKVTGYGRSRANLELAKKLGVIDEIAGTVVDAAKEADVILLATPVGAMGQILQEIVGVIKTDAVITDVGSVKHGVVAEARNSLEQRVDCFVPGHPIAGKEVSGVAAADPDLYENHKVALTPLPESRAAAIDKITEMWQSVGADVVEMGVDEHDRVLAMTSHLPHVLAYAMVHLFAEGEDREKCYQMAAGGFYDFTRIASSDPVMWRDICDMNQEQILHHIAAYQKKLDEISEMISRRNTEDVEALFADARTARAVVTEKRKQKSDAQESGSYSLRVRQQVNR